MSVAKYLPYALVAGGAIVLWRLSKGVQAALPAAPSPVNGYRPGSMWAASDGMGHLGFGFKSVVKQAVQAATTPMKAAAAPLRVAAAPIVAMDRAAKTAIKTGSISAGTKAGVQALKVNSAAPITSITRGTTAFQSTAMQNSIAKAMSSTAAARAVFGTAKPITKSGTPATTAAAAVSQVTWVPVMGAPGWSTAPGEGGTTVFKGPAGQMFSATPGDISSLGGNVGTINYYLSITAPSTNPVTSSSPGLPTQPSGDGSGSGQSFTDPSLDPNYQPIPQQATYTDPGVNTAAAMDPTAAADPTAVDQSAAAQQTVDPTVQPAPADSSSLHPLVAVGALVAVPALFFLGGKH